MSVVSLRMDKVLFRHSGSAEPFQFDIAFKPNAITAIMGPSGAGKSTLLNLLAGFEQVESGRITLGDDELTSIHPSARPISMIFQDNNVFAHLTVGDNVGLGIHPGLRLTHDERARVQSALRDVGLDGYQSRMPSTLSGGERQRVGLARVLVRNHPALLLDEALASLGPGMRRSILSLIQALQQRRNLTVIMTTHDPADASHIADDLVFVADRRVIATGPVLEMIDAPTDPRVAAYLGDGV